MNKDKFSIEQRCEKCGTTFQSKMGPEWLLKKYGQILCRRCGHHANMIKKYGSEEEYQKAKDRIYSGIRKRNYERYGVEWISQSDLFKERTKEGLKKAQDQRMKTLKKNNMEQYGVEYTFQREDCKEHRKQTMLDRYGVEHPLQSEEFLEKSKQTTIERFGADNVMRNEKIKERVVQKLKDKTCEEWSEIASKRRKRIQYDGTYFDSQWEVKVWKFCKEHGISIERGPVVELKNGQKFEIDFLINGKPCEVKSSWISSIRPENTRLKQEYLQNHGGLFISDNEMKDLSFLLNI